LKEQAHVIWREEWITTAATAPSSASAPFVDSGASGFDRFLAVAEHPGGHAVRVALAGEEVERPLRSHGVS
jgi:hypothetical protein